MARSNNLVQLAALFLAKFGALIVGVVFLPIYNRQLGSAAFGVVAVILSAQSFALLADFGMTTLVGRDLALADATPASARTSVRLAESSISAAYAVIFVFVAVAAAAMRPSLSTASVSGCVLLIYLSVIQNINQTALLARKAFALASVAQVIGVVARAALTTAAIIWWSNTIETFIWMQCATTAAHALCTRQIWRLRLGLLEPQGNPRVSKLEILGTLKRGAPPLLSGIAGAAVLQLDKPIISAFMPSTELAPYFLATSFSILPTSLLAAPVVQYFQPQLLSLVGTQQGTESPPHLVIQKFTITLFALVGLPTLIIWFLCPEIIDLWLHGSTNIEKVVHYCRILLPAFALGSLSYVPVVLLLAAQDFKYQAALAAALTAGTLFAVTVCSAAQRIDLACFAYLGYFLAAAAGVWLRSFALDTTRHFAALGAASSFKPAGVLLVAFIGAYLFAAG